MVRRRTPARKKRTGRAPVGLALGQAPAKRSGAWLIVILGALVLVNLYVFVWDKKTSVHAIKEQAQAATPGSGTAMSIPSLPLAVAHPTAGSAAPVEPSAPAPIGPATTVEGKVAKSDTLGKLLKKSGLTAGEADEVIRSLAGVLDFKTIRAGQTYKIERGADGRVRRFELDLSKTHHVQTVRQATGELVGSADS